MPLPEEILSKCFDLEHYELKKILTPETNKLIFVIDNPGPRYCGQCGTCAGRYDSSEQEFLIGSLNAKAIYARTKVYRVRCPLCGIVTENHGIAEGKKRYSKPVGKVLVKYTEKLDNKAVSELFGISDATVYRIDKEELKELCERYQADLPEVKRLSVDETAYKRGHHYASILTDYERSKVLWIEKGRNQKDLENAYDTLDLALKSVEVVTMDFWVAFENATRKKLPQAKIIYDRFHISRLLNRAIEDERRAYQRTLSTEDRRMIKRHSRWVLLRREKNLSEKHKDHLLELQQANERLFQLYLLKEDFLSIFDAELTRRQACREMINWIRKIRLLDFSALKRFAKSILRRIHAVLDWFKHPVSNGKAEGINNVIKTLIKRAYGYKNFEYFRLKVLQKCGLIMNYATHTF